MPSPTALDFLADGNVWAAGFGGVRGGVQYRTGRPAAPRATGVPAAHPAPAAEWW